MQDSDNKERQSLPKATAHETKQVKWKKLVSRELQDAGEMTLKTLLKRVLQAVGKSDSKAARAVMLARLTKSSQFQIHDGIIKLSSI